MKRSLAENRRIAVRSNGNHSLVKAIGRGAAWENFAVYLARNGCSPGQAVSASGIAVPAGYDADSYGRELMTRPAVLSRVQGEQHRVIRGELVHKALRCLGEIMDNPHAAEAARVSAARLTLDAAGLLTRAQNVPAGNVPDERGSHAGARLTPAELQRQLRETRDQIQALKSTLSLLPSESPEYRPDIDGECSQAVDI